MAAFEENEERKEKAHQLLESYLLQKGINTKKMFQCLNSASHKHNDKNPSMKYYENPGEVPIVKCFACGFSGDVFDVIGFEYNLSGADKFSKTYEVLGIDADFKPYIHQKKGAWRNEMNVEVKREIAQQRAENAKEELIDYSAYLDSCATRIAETDYHRGISIETLREFKVGYDPHAQLLRSDGTKYGECKGLIIPTGNGKNSFIIRNTEKNTDDKYRFWKTKKVDMLNAEALKKPYRAIFVVESEIDCLSVHDVVKKYNATCVGLGSTSNYKLLLHYLFDLSRSKANNCYDNTIYLLLDNDKAGKDTTSKFFGALLEQEFNNYNYKQRKNLTDDPISIMFQFKDISELLGKYKDPNEALLDNRDDFEENIKPYVFETLLEYNKDSAGVSIESFYDDILRHASESAYKTRFEKLDELLDGGLYEGLYAIGAGTSTGKTTFIVQVADAVAQQDYDVVYVALEMSKNELMAKSISRLTAMFCQSHKIPINNAKTTRGILTGNRYAKYSESELTLIQDSIETYKKFANNIYYWEGIGNIGVAEIRQRVKKHIFLTEKKPLLIVDYLQILSPRDVRATDKANVDYNILELKRISRDYHIPIIIISSFNRANYKTVVDFDSFKESGGIDYGCDVIIGMQIKGQGTDEYDAKLAKSKNPRELELYILKNRNGAVGGTVEYKYYPMFNYFVEVK